MTTIKVMTDRRSEIELYNFQKEAIRSLVRGKHIVVSQTGSGKGAMAVMWAREVCNATNKDKVLVVTTASKANMKPNDFELDADKWCSPSFRESLSSFTIISWHKLAAWTKSNWAHVGEYVFIFDECLPADTKVETQNDSKEIADIRVGDMVLSYNHNTRKLEYKRVLRTIRRPSPNKMIRLHLADGTIIISTGNHPHWTQNGYKSAEDIKEGDLLYETRTIRETKSGDKKSRRIWSIHKLRHLRGGDKRRRSNKVPERQTKNGEGKLLLSKVWESGNKQERERGDGRREAERTTKKDVIREAKEEQLLQRPNTKSKGARDKEEEWMATNMGQSSRTKGWKRKILRATKNLMEETKRSKQGLGDGTACVARKMDERLSEELQVGYRKRLLQDRGRMRWAKPQFSENQSKGREEKEEIRGVRVESIEVLELRDIKRLGLYRDADNVYCIDVEGNHNFFANGVLTHNCAKASAGVSSGMGKAFLKITSRNHDWAGFTATPGDVWIKFYPYFQACGLVTNKTQFMRKYCVMQTFKGYPEIVNYLYTDELKRFWMKVSVAPDTSQMTRELPSETHKTLGFKKPSTYNRTLKTRISPDGDMLDTPGALCAELRRQCFTNEKRQWISDFVENLGDGAVMFYNYIKTGDELEGVIKKVLPKGAKIWRIDGKHHDIPTADTIGKYDIVLCQWQSGSEALNLQFLHYWVAVELCYSYSTAVQARGRIKRLGQQSLMRYYYLLTDGTIEQAILKCLKEKSTFSEDVWEAELKERSK